MRVKKYKARVDLAANIRYVLFQSQTGHVSLVWISEILPGVGRGFKEEVAREQESALFRDCTETRGGGAGPAVAAVVIVYLTAQIKSRENPTSMTTGDNGNNSRQGFREKARRGHQMSLQMVVNHQSVAGN